MKRTAFLCGCGFGNRLAIVPKSTAELAPVREFTDSLRKLGGRTRTPADEIDQAAQRAVDSLADNSDEKKKVALTGFLDSFKPVPDAVRAAVSEEDWKWFTLGHLLMLIPTAMLLDNDFTSELSALETVAQTIEIPKALKKHLDKFVNRSRKGSTLDKCLEDANAFSRAAWLTLDDSPALRHTTASDSGPATVFVGHGRSNVWKDLKDFLVERLGLQYEEFNRESIAGRSTKERLLEMLERCSFAFLIMTAEDEHGDGRRHARLNVVHEIGLFQGRWGFERAIVLLEEGCEEFSNIAGIGQIRFRRGEVAGVFEDIRRVLEREGVCAAINASSLFPVGGR